MYKSTCADAQGASVTSSYSEFPDACPICHHAIVPREVSAAYKGEAREGTLNLLLQCPRKACEYCFVALYEAAPGTGQGPDYHRLVSTWPRTAQTEAFSDVIRGMSPAFVEIYNQAMEAEAAALDQLTGIGLRKALEFLVKDFAVSRAPKKEKEIRQRFLGKVISSYIDDANVAACAKRAAWLGNDEAHYTRRWEDQDIDDLKRLLRLTVNWIENVLLTEAYVAEMSVDEAE